MAESAQLYVKTGQDALQWVKLEFSCESCDAVYGSIHEALTCCVDCPDDEKCLSAVIQVEPGAPYGVCHCEGFMNETGCGTLVCFECHEEFSGQDKQRYMLAHQRDSHSVNYDPPVDVGGPRSLPPAMGYTPEQIKVCAMCASDEFCCSVHGNHKSPHRGCMLRGELKA